MTEGPPTVELDQIERYRFEARYPGEPFAALQLDEPLPTGGGTGPGPVQTLATAVGHCMSSTLINTLERARVPHSVVHAVVVAEVGTNDRGRRRVRRLTVHLRVQPLNPEDRGRFEHSVAIFEDFCTVSGAVREGIPIDADVGPPAP